MEDYFNNVGQNITSSEAKVLVKQILALPEHADLDYDVKKVQLWFARQRMRKSAKVKATPPVASTSSISATPATKPLSNADLPQEALDELVDLFSENSTPSEKLMTIWARILSVDLHAVRAWVRNRQNPERLGNTHLPTPSHSISPEPISPFLPHHVILKQEASTSPRVTTPGLPPSLSKQRSATSFPSACPVSSTPHIPFRDNTRDILSHLFTAMFSPQQSPNDQMEVDNVSSLTLGELNSKFAPYERSIQTFLDDLDSGCLEEIGWSLDHPPDSR
jgi:hypothetical protein